MQNHYPASKSIVFPISKPLMIIFLSVISCSLKLSSKIHSQNARRYTICVCLNQVQTLSLAFDYSDFSVSTLQIAILISDSSSPHVIQNMQHNQKKRGIHSMLRAAVCCFSQNRDRATTCLLESCVGFSHIPPFPSSYTHLYQSTRKRLSVPYSNDESFVSCACLLKMATKNRMLGVCSGLIFVVWWALFLHSGPEGCALN